MSGQAVVRITDKEWNVAAANTYAELTSGLSGVKSIPPQTGMLFDLGYDQKYIQINMSQMLFPLDIIFINSTQGVVGVLHNVQPREEASLQNEALPGARCFLEINAGEAEGIEVGDNVAIERYAQTTQFDISGLINVMAIMIMMVIMTKVLEPKKPKLPQPQLLPQTKNEFKSGEIVKYKGERVRVLEQIGDRVNIFIPSRRELVWVKPEKLERTEPPASAQRERQVILVPIKGAAPFAIRPYPGEEVAAVTKFRVKRFEKEPDYITSVFYVIRKKGEITDIAARHCFKNPDQDLDTFWLPDYRPPDDILRRMERETGFKFPREVWAMKVRWVGYIPQSKGPTFLPLATEGGKYAWALFDRETGEIMIKENFFTRGRAQASARAFGIQRAKEVGMHTLELRLYDRSPDIDDLAKGVIFKGQLFLPEGRIVELTEKEPRVVPIKEPERKPLGELEYFADSPEFLAQTIEDIGYREKLDTAFQEAIARAREK